MQANTGFTRLPTELVDRLTKPFARFLGIEAAAAAVLLISTVAALFLSNSPWAHPFLNAWETRVGLQIGALELARSLKDWINDGLMTLFFFLVALELKRELILGELNKPRIAALSIAGALGGMVVPAGLYLTLQSSHPGETGWGTVMATDTAFVIGCLAFSWLAVRSGIAIRPPDLDWRLLAGGGLLAGIGFTMALFIANLAFSKSLIDGVKLGILLAAVFSAGAGLALLMWVPERGRPPRVDRG